VEVFIIKLGSTIYAVIKSVMVTDASGTVCIIVVNSLTHHNRRRERSGMSIHVHDDAVQKALMEIVRGYINDVSNHRLDEDKIMGEIDNIICELEELAMSCEMGEYELPEQERND